jgi:lactate dehydrogenase-like 2-hydroxyacid dehydrogenase
MSPRKPKVVTISPPNWADPEYLKEWETKFELHVSEAGDRQTTIKNLAAKVTSDGPFDAICILMGTKPYEPFDEELLKPLVPHCKLMTSASAGFNEFDVDWMSRNGITFCNSRNAVNEASADLAIFMMLGAIRDVQRLQTSVANGKWRGGLVPARDPCGMKLGIVGMGAIGKHVARKAKVFNMDIIYHQRTRMLPEDEKLYDAKFCSTLDELLSTADVVSLHCPLNKNTEGMISHKEFAKMKDGVFFINTSRGPLANEEALIEALESRKICRAGLDVFHNEPRIK